MNQLLACLLALLLGFQNPASVMVPSQRAAANPAAYTIQRVEVVCVSQQTTLTFGTATTLGELIAVITGIGAVGPDGGITDNKSGGSSTYTSIFNSGLLVGHDTANFYYTANAAAGITTLTFAVGSGNSITYGGFCAGHYKGIATSSPIDVSKTWVSGQSYTGWSSTATGTLSVANEVAVGAMMNYVGNGNLGSFTVNSPFTKQGTTTSNSGVQMVYADDIVSSTASLTFSGSSPSTGGTSSTTVAIVTFKVHP